MSTVTGIFSSDTLLPTMSATGIITHIKGTFSSNISLPTMNSVGITSTLIFGHFGAWGIGNLPMPIISANGVAKGIGVFSSDTPIPTMSASGRVGIKGQFSTILPIPTLSAIGSIKNAGVFSSSIPILTMSATGITSTLIIGTINISIPLPVISSLGIITKTTYDTIYEKLRARVAEAHKFMASTVRGKHTCTVYKNGETQAPIPGAIGLNVIAGKGTRLEENVFDLTSDISTVFDIEVANQNGWEQSDLHPQNYWLKLGSAFFEIRDVSFTHPIDKGGRIRPSVAIISCSRVKRAHGQGANLG